MKTGLDPMSLAEIRSVARQLNVKPEEVSEMEARLAGQEMALEPASDEDEGRLAPIAYLADGSPEPSEVLESRQDDELRTSGLRSALADLDPRSRRIIEARWLREKDQATLHDLASEFKVSAERIRQIEAKAMEKMKKAMLADSAPREALPAPA